MIAPFEVVQTWIYLCETQRLAVVATILIPQGQYSYPLGHNYLTTLPGT